MTPSDIAGRTRTGADAALARSAVYRLLAQAFVYPTAAAVQDLRRQDLPFAQAMGHHLDDGVRSVLDDLAEAARGMSTRRLERAFARTFSHVHSADRPPYETDFTTKEVFRQSQELADLGGFYRAFGLAESPDERERADHVSVELEFLHLLSYKEAWALAEGDDEGAETCRRATERFLADHVLRWVPEFARRVSAVDDEIYAAAARLSLGFLESEARQFDLAWPGDGGAVTPPRAIEEVSGLCEEGA